MLQNFLLATWGCIPELSKDCQDMTNASSTYLGIAIGAIIGGIISWWIYNRQNKTSEKQELTLNHIKELNERHDSILKMEHIIERQDKLHKSIQSKALSSKDDYAETGE
jgi:Na+/glutamate symporter